MYYIKDSLFNLCLYTSNLNISNATTYPTYTRIQLIFYTSQDTKIHDVKPWDTPSNL